MGHDIGVAKRCVERETLAVRSRIGEVAIRLEVPIEVEPRSKREVDPRIDWIIRRRGRHGLAREVMAVVEPYHRSAFARGVPRQPEAW